LNRDTIIQQDILKALAYFDIFRYPLTAEEITLFLHSPATGAEVQKQILLLQQELRVFCIDGLYMLQDDVSLAERRKKGNQSAVKEIEKAKKIARWLFRFPFVRSIAVSGSLSKNYADEQTDIDFFVITAGDRLWLARTLLHILYKLPRFTGKRRPFCLNYYIDDAVMEIEEKNIFTATEIITLLPLEGQTTFKQFRAANEWVSSYYPQHKAAPVFIHNPGSRFKKLLEALFSNRFGNWLEQRLMQATNRRWQQKMLRNAVNEKGVKISMKSGGHYAKPDPENFQRNIINLYEQRLRELSAVADLMEEKDSGIK
jgi:predicted nucleotidyltransferase